VENNSEYMFEYTSDISMEGEPEYTEDENVGDYEEDVTEDISVGEPEV